jgi:hypothetical protein
MKENFRIKPHSLIDIITNSSTEIFTIKGDYELEFVQDGIVAKAIDLGYPVEDQEYLRRSIYLNEIDQYPFDKETIEMYVSFLRKKGYAVIVPAEPKPVYEIVLSVEMGEVSEHSKLGQFIIDTFKAEYDQC